MTPIEFHCLLAAACQQEFQHNCFHPHCAAAAVAAALLVAVVVALMKLKLAPECSASFLGPTIGWVLLICSSVILQTLC